jgi:serine acetyltransferase
MIDNGYTYYLFYIKRIDAKNGCSFGTNINSGLNFLSPPYLPHGPNGIVVGQDAKVGNGCIIYHQVTIAGGNVVIGDRVELGAGAKVLPNVTIGNYARVGANCVVVEDIPDNATVVLQKPRIILK